jgi:hypothetical protein
MMDKRRRATPDIRDRSFPHFLNAVQDGDQVRRIPQEWGLGAIIYERLTGRLHFAGECVG